MSVCVGALLAVYLCVLRGAMSDCMGLRGFCWIVCVTACDWNSVYSCALGVQVRECAHTQECIFCGIVTVSVWAPLDLEGGWSCVCKSCLQAGRSASELVCLCWCLTVTLCRSWCLCDCVTANISRWQVCLGVCIASCTCGSECVCVGNVWLSSWVVSVTAMCVMVA